MYAAGIRLPPYLTCAGSRPTVWSWSLKEYLAPATTPLLPPSAGASPVPGSGMVTSPCYVIVMMLCCLLCQGVITISVRMCVQMLPGSFCIHDAGDCGVRGHILSRLPQFLHLHYDGHTIFAKFSFHKCPFLRWRQFAYLICPLFRFVSLFW